MSKASSGREVEVEEGEGSDNERDASGGMVFLSHGHVQLKADTLNAENVYAFHSLLFKRPKYLWPEGPYSWPNRN